MLGFAFYESTQIHICKKSRSRGAGFLCHTLIKSKTHKRLVFYWCLFMRCTGRNLESQKAAYHLVHLFGLTDGVMADGSRHNIRDGPWNGAA